jgi:hypothetical protein
MQAFIAFAARKFGSYENNPYLCSLFALKKVKDKLYDDKRNNYKPHRELYGGQW